MTISNYEYILQWVFDTAANIHYEVRATGIMSLVPADQNTDHDSINYGVIVSPGVMAPIHQHIFCLRIDPAVDSYNEGTIVYEDVKRMGWNAATNPYGVAFGVESTPIEKESFLDLDARVNRAVKMINPTRKNQASHKPAGYKVVIPQTQLQLAEPGSLHGIRAEFADHHFYFTKQDEDELYPAGDFPWQSVGGKQLLDITLTPRRRNLSHLWLVPQRTCQMAGFETGSGHIVTPPPYNLCETTHLVF